MFPPQACSFWSAWLSARGRKLEWQDMGRLEIVYGMLRNNTQLSWKASLLWACPSSDEGSVQAGAVGGKSAYFQNSSFVVQPLTTSVEGSRGMSTHVKLDRCESESWILQLSASTPVRGKFFYFLQSTCSFSHMQNEVMNICQMCFCKLKYHNEYKVESTLPCYKYSVNLRFFFLFSRRAKKWILNTAAWIGSFFERCGAIYLVTVSLTPHLRD